MRSFFHLLIALLFGSAAVCNASFIEDLAKPTSWEKTVDVIFRDIPRKTLISRVDAKAIRIPRQDLFKVGDFSHGDVVLRWNDAKKLERVEIIVYNKGDDGDVTQDEFKSKLKELETCLKDVLQIEGKASRMDKRDTGVTGRTKVWTPEGCGTWLLEYSSTGRGKNFNSEFIRLTIGADIEKGGAADAACRDSLKENVVTEDDGTVWIKNIPMVDQGKKGYCVPATAARVFAYYGMDGVDQHAMAALCQSRSGAGGTSLPEMREALQKLGRAFHFRVKTMEDCSIENMIALYNKEAKKKKAMQITPETIYFFSFNEEIMRAARTRNASKVKKWMAEVKKSIDEGVPVLWCVMLGIFKEQGLPQNGGGHMRLIIGYNLEDKTIIYSDSWGARHARKEMPLEDAFSMTVERNIMRLSR